MSELVNKTNKKSDTAKPQKIKFFFSGEGKYKPLTIEASSLEEAEKLYKKEREKVEQLQENNNN